MHNSITWQLSAALYPGESQGIDDIRNHPLATRNTGVHSARSPITSRDCMRGHPMLVTKCHKASQSPSRGRPANKSPPVCRSVIFPTTNVCRSGRCLWFLTVFPIGILAGEQEAVGSYRGPRFVVCPPPLPKAVVCPRPDEPLCPRSFLVL